jgi:hypothetical protein
MQAPLAQETLGRGLLDTRRSDDHHNQKPYTERNADDGRHETTTLAHRVPR